MLDNEDQAFISGLILGAIITVCLYSIDGRNQNQESVKEPEIILACKTNKYKDNIRNKILTCVEH